jgi:tetratricopeptide (TPR) repeat protein
MIVNVFPNPLEESSDSSRFIEQGEQLFHQGKFALALKMFEKAIPLTNDDEVLAGLYLKVSLIHFKLNNPHKSEESLRSMFELDTDLEIDEAKFETAYSMIYKKIKAEYWFSVRTKTEAEKKEDRQIIQKLSEKPEKKKNKWLPIVLISGVVIAIAVMAVLFWQNEDDLKRGTLRVYNASEYSISVIVGTTYRNCSSHSHVNIMLEVGTYTVEIIGQGATQTHTVTIEEDETSVIHFYGL